MTAFTHFATTRLGFDRVTWSAGVPVGWRGDVPYDLAERWEAWQAALAAPRAAEPVELADRLHDAWVKWSRAESDLLESIDLSGWDFYDLWTDDYDNSVEFHVCGTGSPPATVLAALWAAGFDRAWFNYSDGTERYCAKGSTVPSDPVAKSHPRVSVSMERSPAVRALRAENERLKASAPPADLAERVQALRALLAKVAPFLPLREHDAFLYGTLGRKQFEICEVLAYEVDRSLGNAAWDGFTADFPALVVAAVNALPALLDALSPATAKGRGE